MVRLQLLCGFMHAENKSKFDLLIGNITVTTGVEMYIHFYTRPIYLFGYCDVKKK